MRRLVGGAVLAIVTLAGAPRAEGWLDREALLALAGQRLDEAHALADASRFTAALPNAQEALALFEAVYGDDHLVVADAAYALGALHQRLDAPHAARLHYERALALWERALGPSHDVVAATLSQLAMVVPVPAAAPLLERAVAIRTQSHGPDDAVATDDLWLLGDIRRMNGDRDGAWAAFARVLDIRERAGDGPGVAAALDGLAAILHGRGELAAARAHLERAAALREKALPVDARALGGTLQRLAVVLDELERHADVFATRLRAIDAYEDAGELASPDAEHVIKMLTFGLHLPGLPSDAAVTVDAVLARHERALGPRHPQVVDLAVAIAALHRMPGPSADSRAVAYQERAIRLREHALGAGHPDVAESVEALADLYRAAARYRDAQPLYEQALAIRERALGSSHPGLTDVLGSLASVLFALGDYAAARARYEHALAIAEAAHGPEHLAVGTILNNLANVLTRGGDLDGARRLYARAVRIAERAKGPSHATVAASLSNLAGTVLYGGDAAAARPLYERAVAICDRIPDPCRGVWDVGEGFHGLAQVLSRLGERGAARQLFERAVARLESTHGPAHHQLAIALIGLGRQHHEDGEHAAARMLYERALALREQAVGVDHVDVASVLYHLALVHRRAGDHAAARARYERARRIDLRAATDNVELDDAFMEALRARTRSGLPAYIELLADEPATGAVHAFHVVEQLRSGSAQAALARAALRRAARAPEIAALARAVQDQHAHVTHLRGRLVAAHAAAEDSGERVQAAEALRRAEEELRAAIERLRRDFPRFRELAVPAPIDVAEVQGLLSADEALATFSVHADRVLVWLVRRDGRPAFARTAIARDELVGLVRRMRRSVDQQDNPDLSVGQLTPFDVTAASELHRILLGPLAGELRGVRHLIVVPDDSLVSIPFGALITRPEGDAYQRLADLHARGLSPAATELPDHAKVAWLIKDHAISIVPSATSLRALRALPHAAGAGDHGLLAFGDPVLTGTATFRGGAMPRRGSDTVAAVRELGRLPGTRDEMLALAAALRADPETAVHLGARATKPHVLALNASGRLARTRVVAFATHGLLAGELDAVTEPALVLTPPAQPSADDDGLLRLGDVLSLRLDAADWVVLSACNTGAGDASGEALSGLARAFFFAGAQTLLVSHWSVEDRATQALMTAVFARYAADRTVPKAEALRRGMLEVMARGRGATAHFAHPFAWAPFFVVGDGK